MSPFHSFKRVFLLFIAALCLHTFGYAQNRKGQIEPDKFWQDASKGLEWISSSESIPAPRQTSFLEIAPDSMSSPYAAIVDPIFDNDVHRILLLAKGRKVLHRTYNKNWVDEKSRPISFSMAKSLVGLAVGKALCTGAIKNLDDPLQTYSSRLIGTSWGEAKFAMCLQ